MLTSIITHLFINALIVSVNSDWGPFRSILYSDWITCDRNHDLNIDVSEVQVYFHDFKNNFNLTFPIHQAAQGINNAYNLDVTRKLVVFVPGYKSHISRKTEELVRQTFQDVPNTYLILFDHSTYTSAKDGKLKSYERSVLNSYYIGKAIGEMLSDMKKLGYPSNNIHCIGHSLGSQMLSVAGETYINKTSEKLWRITGLDPAGPCFSNSFINDQIRSGVAHYVEVYHCNAGGLGTTSVLADADFFFNHEGSNQPKCDGSYLPVKGESDAAKCSHKACVRYYMKTVHNPGWFLAWKCNSYRLFEQGRCAANEVTIAGYGNPGNATGIFYVSTGGYSGIE